MTEVTPLVTGDAGGEVLILDEPLSLWGGVDPASGRIVEPGHPQFGVSLAGKIVVMPHGRGSSSSSSILAELLRGGVGPSAIVLDRPDSILVTGALVGADLYGSVCPVVVGDIGADGGDLWVIEGKTARPGEK